MKKIAKCFSLIFTVLAMSASFAGCYLGGIEDGKGTLRVKISNTTTIPLTVTSISNEFGSYTTETTIKAGENNTFTVNCATPADTIYEDPPEVSETTIKAYYMSGAEMLWATNTAVPYRHDSLVLDKAGSNTVTMLLEFRRESDGKYVLGYRKKIN